MCGTYSEGAAKYVSRCKSSHTLLYGATYQDLLSPIHDLSQERSSMRAGITICHAKTIEQAGDKVHRGRSQKKYLHRHMQVSHPKPWVLDLVLITTVIDQITANRK